MDDKLKILVDDVLQPTIKGALPLGNIPISTTKVLEISRSALMKSLEGTLAQVMHLVAEMPKTDRNVTLKEVVFSLAFDAKGEVSLLSVAKGSLGGQTGLTFKLEIA